MQPTQANPSGFAWLRTRAIEYLEVFAYEKRGLVLEIETALARMK